MKRRLISMLLTLCMLLSFLPTAAFATETTNVGGTETAVVSEEPAESEDPVESEDPTTPVESEDPTTPVESEESTTPAESEGQTPSVASIDGAYYATLAEAVAAAQSGETVTLLADVDEVLTAPAAENVTLDLNNKTLTMKNTASVYIKDGKSFTIQNGIISALNYPNGASAAFAIEKGSSMTLDNVGVDCNGTILYPAGDAASVTVVDSELLCGGYAVTTNAGTSGNYGVKITLTESTFASRYGYANNDMDSAPL